MNNDLLNTILKGASKSLYIVNEAIPIYKDTAPLFKNIKNLVNKKENNNIVREKTVKEDKKETIKKNLDINQSDSNNPKFFI